ncbi:CotO family spore coat protein [Neobacillus drentensis]|uniref:CotO family spore coat protein n=1 Tax=Neobacillus drentensis TaxID=220684 RepID=UPI0030021AED
MSENKSKGPLLYIHQPFARTPATNMQDIYMSRQEEEELVEEEKLLEAESKKKIVQEPIGTEASRSDNPATKSPTSIQERQHSPFNRVKPFKEMDIKERLDYLIKYPIVLPPPPCVFITEEKSYQGYLTEYDGNEVTIRFHDKSTKTVPVHELKGVILIGLKK